MGEMLGLAVREAGAERNPKENARVGRVDHAVVVRVHHELNEVEKAAVARERRLRGQTGQIDWERRRLCGGAQSKQRESGCGVSRGTWANRGAVARDRHAD